MFLKQLKTYFKQISVTSNYATVWQVQVHKLSGACASPIFFSVRSAKHLDWKLAHVDLEGVSRVDICLDSAPIPQTAARSRGPTSKRRISSRATLRAPLFILKPTVSPSVFLSLAVAASPLCCLLTCTQHLHSFCLTTLTLMSLHFFSF